MTSERMTGIEPASSVWKTEALPLSYIREAPIAGIAVTAGGAGPESIQADPHAGVMPVEAPQAERRITGRWDGRGAYECERVSSGGLPSGV